MYRLIRHLGLPLGNTFEMLVEETHEFPLPGEAAATWLFSWSDLQESVRPGTDRQPAAGIGSCCESLDRRTRCEQVKPAGHAVYRYPVGPNLRAMREWTDRIYCALSKRIVPKGHAMQLIKHRHALCMLVYRSAQHISVHI